MLRDKTAMSWMKRGQQCPRGSWKIFAKDLVEKLKWDIHFVKSHELHKDSQDLGNSSPGAGILFLFIDDKTGFIILYHMRDSKFVNPSKSLLSIPLKAKFSALFLAVICFFMPAKLF